jgi:hypothetical protein
VDLIIKWKIGEILSYEEGLKVLKELFVGANKNFHFDVEQKIDDKLYRLYLDFEEDITGKYILNFSNKNCFNNVISFMEFENVVHRIKTIEGTIFVHEFTPRKLTLFRGERNW